MMVISYTFTLHITYLYTVPIYYRKYMLHKYVNRYNYNKNRGVTRLFEIITFCQIDELHSVYSVNILRLVY